MKDIIKLACSLVFILGGCGENGLVSEFKLVSFFSSARYNTPQADDWDDQVYNKLRNDCLNHLREAPMWITYPLKTREFFCECVVNETLGQFSPASIEDKDLEVGVLQEKIKTREIMEKCFDQARKN